MKILILASNPRKDLNLDDEIRDLQDVIEKSRNRQEFKVEIAPAVRVGDLQDLLHRHKPQIVHFCGHGSGQQGLVFKGNDGGEQWVRADALSDLFRLFSSNVGCVLLNACYSEEQADAIVNHIDYVIGMNQEIRDDAAIAFSKGFYRALGYECSIEDAYEFGRNAIQLEISGSSKVRSAATEQQRKAEVVDAVATVVIPEHSKPVLKRKTALTQGSALVIPGSSQPLSQIKREEIQLDVAKTLIEEDSNHQQYRENVREILSDDKLSPFEAVEIDEKAKELKLSEEEAKRILEEEKEEHYRILVKKCVADLELRQPGWKERLDAIQQSIGLSVEKGKEILETELASIKKAQQDYGSFLNTLIQRGLYPFDKEAEQGLKKRQQQKKLTAEEVAQVSEPILQQAKTAYRQQLKQRYEDKFRNALEAIYPLPNTVRDQLKNCQQELGLTTEEVEQIEQPLLAPKKAEYQVKLERLAEEKRRREAERQFELERQREVEEQRQEQLKQEAAENQRQAEAQETQRQETEELKQQQEELERQQVLEQQRQEEAQRWQAAQTASANELASESGVDYTRLRDLLKAGRWKEADQETIQVILKASGREGRDHLLKDDIERFSCTDLSTIDQLWVKYSDGKFGFSVQKKIWEEVGQEFHKFHLQVGWRVSTTRIRESGTLWMKRKEPEETWSSVGYDKLTFSLAAPKGHLPFGKGIVWGDWGGYSGMSSRGILWSVLELDLLSR